MIPRLSERTGQARRGELTTSDAGFVTFFLVFFGTLVLEIVGEVWRQSHGGVGYAASFTPWTGLLLVALPAPGTRKALHDEAAQRVTHAVVGLTAAALTPAFLAGYESLSRDAHTGMGHMRAPTVYATSAAFAALLVWPLLSRANAFARRAVPALALALALASLTAALTFAPRLWSRPEAVELLRGASLGGELPRPDAWPGQLDEGPVTMTRRMPPRARDARPSPRDDVRRADDARVPFALFARCERWYCDLRGEPAGAAWPAFPGHWYPSLLRDKPVSFRLAGDVVFLSQPTGETTFHADGRYASLASLADRVRPPDPWLFGAFTGAALALTLLVRARRVRKTHRLDDGWFPVTIQPDGTALDADKRLYAVEVVGPTPPLGPAFARRERAPQAAYREGAVPVLREVLSGDATTLAQALDAWVLACDARALAAAAWGGGSLLAWAYATGLR
ncbi:MAG: hypothetical protein U0324_05415 [Polyangiales bacterium]